MHKQVFTSASIQSFENGMTTSSVSKVFLKFITQHSSFHFTTSQVNEQQKVQKPTCTDLSHLTSNKSNMLRLCHHVLKTSV